MDGGAPPGDERDVSAGQLDVLLLAAADAVDEGAYAFGRRDVIFLRAHDEDGARDALEPDRPAAHDELTSEELVVLVEVPHPLTEELAGKRHVLVRPLVQRLESLDVLVVPQVPPEIQVGRQVHRRLEELEARLHHVGRDRAERIDEAVDVEILLAEPEPEEPDLREVDRAG